MYGGCPLTHYQFLQFIVIKNIHLDMFVVRVGNIMQENVAV